MTPIVLLIVVALVGLVWREVRQGRRDAAIQSMLLMFGPAQAAVQSDARQLLTWQPLAEASRRLFPDAFDAVDKATGKRFPFPKEIIEQAHAKWTADWLAWEKAHDEEYRLKAATAEQEIMRASSEGAALARARLDRIQHEKVERYQQRYEEYIRTAKALQALLQ